MAVVTPLLPLHNRLAGGHNAVLQVIGDSTSYGSYDAQWWDKFGWVGRLGILVGDEYDCNVQLSYYLRWNPPGPGTFGSSASGPAAYSESVLIREAADEDAPTLLIMLGSIPGATWSYYSVGMVSPDSDLVIVWTGFNEINATAAANGYDSFVAAVKSAHPDVPIIATTENDTTNAHHNGRPWITYTQIFGAIVNRFLPGDAMPLDPVLKHSTSIDCVWMLDSRQCALQSSGDLWDGLHPAAAGNDKIAAWLYETLVGEGVPGGGGGQPGGDFLPDSICEPKIKLAGMWYPTRPYVLADGSFQPAMARH